MKKVTRFLRELLTRTMTLISAFGIWFHPAGFYKLDRIHSLPPEAKPVTDRKDSEEAYDESGRKKVDHYRQPPWLIDANYGEGDASEDEGDGESLKDDAAFVEGLMVHI